MSTWTETLDALVRERGSALYGYAFVATGDRAAASNLLRHALSRSFRHAPNNMPVDAAHAYVKREMQSAVFAGREFRDRRPLGNASSAATSSNAVHDAIVALPARERICVIMRVVDGLSSNQIALELDLDPATIRACVAAGVEQLAHTHAHLGFAPEDLDGGRDEEVFVVDARRRGR